MLTFKFTEVISVFIVHWRTFRTRILLQDLKFLMKPNLRYSFSLVCFLSLFLFFFLTFFPFSKLGKKNCHTKLIEYSVPFKESKITVKWRICITRVFSYVIYIIDETAEIYTSIFIWVDCIPCVSMIFTYCSKKKWINLKKNIYEVKKRGEVYYQIWEFCQVKQAP